MKKKTIKNIFNEKINKKDIYNNVLNCKKTKSKLIPILVTTTAIFIFAVISIVNNQNSKQFSNIRVMQDSNENIVINEIDNLNNNNSFSAGYENNKTSSCLSDKTYSEYSTFEKEIMLSGNLLIPEKLELRSKQRIDFYYECKGQKVFYENTYSNKDMTKKVIIQYANEDIIPNINYKIENPKTSIIEDIQTIIYLYEGSYIATFDHKNIYYKIESTNINQKEFITLLKSIIKE